MSGLHHILELPVIRDAMADIPRVMEDIRDIVRDIPSLVPDIRWVAGIILHDVESIPRVVGITLCLREDNPDLVPDIRNVTGEFNPLKALNELIGALRLAERRCRGRRQEAGAKRLVT